MWRHAAVRTLVLTIVTFNVTFGAAWSVLVLYSLERLGMGEVGFGLLTSAAAFGGLAGHAVLRLARAAHQPRQHHAGRPGHRDPDPPVLAVNTLPAVALVVFFVFGAHAFVWGTISTTVRQRAVPTEMQGRVTSVNLIGVTGGMVDRVRPRWCDRQPLGHHRALLVRLRRLRDLPGADLAPAAAHRPRRRGARRARDGRHPRLTPDRPSTGPRLALGTPPRNARDGWVGSGR